MYKTCVIESPYAGGRDRNIHYARRAYAFALNKDYAPFASHLNYTQPGVLDDSKPDERQRGIDAGFAVARSLHERWFFLDRGFSDGMAAGLLQATRLGQPIRLFISRDPLPESFREIQNASDLELSLIGVDRALVAITREHNAELNTTLTNL